jgi:hypothetical protein
MRFCWKARAKAARPNKARGPKSTGGKAHVKHNTPPVKRIKNRFTCLLGPRKTKKKGKSKFSYLFYFSIPILIYHYVGAPNSINQPFELQVKRKWKKDAAKILSLLAFGIFTGRYND